MNIDLMGKSVAVTGAGGAIGRAVSVAFAQSGANVSVCDIMEESGRETVALIRDNGLNAAYFRLDVTDKNGAAEAFSAIEQTWGGLDILVNNAGINVGPEKRFPIYEFDDADWDRIMHVDLDGVYICSKAAIPYMIAHNGGSILNISSIVGIVPLRDQCAFAAAKAGVIQLTKAMAIELAPRRIRVNAIAPGSVTTNLTGSLFNNPEKMNILLSHVPEGRQAQPEEIAYPAVFLSSDYASYITGQVLAVDGGWTCGFARSL